MSSIALRTALPVDKDKVVELIHQLNVFEADLVGDRRRDYGAAAEYYDELMQRLSRRNGRIVLAETEGVVVAVMGFSLDQDAAYVTDGVRNHGTVTDLIVHDDWRGRGIGQMLLTEAERLTKEAGLKRLVHRRPRGQRTGRAHLPRLRLRALRVDPVEGSVRVG